MGWVGPQFRKVEDRLLRGLSDRVERERELNMYFEMVVLKRRRNGGWMGYGVGWRRRKGSRGSWHTDSRGEVDFPCSMMRSSANLTLFPLCQAVRTRKGQNGPSGAQRAQHAQRVQAAGAVIVTLTLTVSVTVTVTVTVTVLPPGPADGSQYAPRPPLIYIRKRSPLPAIFQACIRQVTRCTFSSARARRTTVVQRKELDGIPHTYPGVSIPW